MIDVVTIKNDFNTTRVTPGKCLIILTGCNTNDINLMHLIMTVCVGPISRILYGESNQSIIVINNLAYTRNTN